MSKRILNITAVEFNHKFIDDVKRLLSEGYVDLPKNYEKHPLKDQRGETIFDVLLREYSEKYIDKTNPAAPQVLKNTLMNLLVGRSKVQRLNDDGTQSEETPLNKLKTKNLSSATQAPKNLNDIWMTDLFADDDMPVVESEEEIAID
jgi:hypothetical protein